MLGQPGKILVRTAASKDLGIPRGNHAPAFTLERSRHNCRTTMPCSSIHPLVHEVHEIVREANGDLLAHTKTVADW